MSANSTFDSTINLEKNDSEADSDVKSVQNPSNTSRQSNPSSRGSRPITIKEKNQIIKQKLIEQCLMLTLVLIFSLLIDFIGFQTIDAKPRNIRQSGNKKSSKSRNRHKPQSHSHSHSQSSKNNQHKSIHHNGPFSPPKYFQKAFSQQYRQQAIDSVYNMFDHAFYKFSANFLYSVVMCLFVHLQLFFNCCCCFFFHCTIIDINFNINCNITITIIITITVC